MQFQDAPSFSVYRRPALQVDVEMVDAGSFDLYCLVHDHYTAGMRATLTVA